MNGKRVARAALVALVAACFGLLCCVGVFYLLWGETPLTRLLPGALFFAAFLLAIPVVLWIGKKRHGA